MVLAMSAGLLATLGHLDTAMRVLAVVEKGVLGQMGHA